MKHMEGFGCYAKAILIDVYNETTHYFTWSTWSTTSVGQLVGQRKQLLQLVTVIQERYIMEEK